MPREPKLSLRNKSHLTNLLVFTEKLTNYDSGYLVNVMYFYFQMASDKIAQNRLIMKLAADGNTLK